MLTVSQTKMSTVQDLVEIIQLDTQHTGKAGQVVPVKTSHQPDLVFITGSSVMYRRSQTGSQTP